MEWGCVGGGVAVSGCQKPLSSSHAARRLLFAVLLWTMASSHALAQATGSSIGIAVTSNGRLDIIFESPAVDMDGENENNGDVSDDSSSRARTIGYAGAALAGLLTLLFIVLVTRLWTIHSMTRRERHNFDKTYQRAAAAAPSSSRGYSPRSSKDMADPAIIEATIARIAESESFVHDEHNYARPMDSDEPLTLVPVCPYPNTITPATVDAIRIKSHAQLRATASSASESQRPKVIRIHSEFEEMESNEEAPPVPKKKSGASKLKVDKSKKQEKS